MGAKAIGAVDLVGDGGKAASGEGGLVIADGFGEGELAMVRNEDGGQGTWIWHNDDGEEEGLQCGQRFADQKIRTIL
ncbi:hypothetical protein SESBI_22354 [Sesbania bispinosa]|nr:hypothetical protein SESBI_22354 [Sesbania bispinosa]